MPTPLNQILKQYVLYDILESSKMEDFFPPKRSESYSTSLRYFSEYCQTILSDSQFTPESIEAMIWTVSNYAYKKLKIDRRYHLASHMRHGARGESSLHLMKEYYRDHFFHTIEVCFLGHLLIDVFKERNKRTIFYKQRSKVIKEWYLTSLLHDIGYAIDISKSLNKWTKFFTSNAFELFYQNIESAIIKINDSKEFKELYGNLGFTEKDKPWEDHGVIGASHLFSLHNDIYKIKEINNFNITNAIKAIGKHNSQKIKISFTEEPLTALLILCDTLQGWNRPQFAHFSLAPSWILSFLVNQFNDFGNIGTVQSDIYSNLTFNKKLKVTFKDPLVFRIEYKQDVNFNSLVFNIWLDMLSNFQRVDFSDLPFNILVQVKTPFLVLNGMQPQAQMSRLFDASEDTHMAYLDSFFEYTKNEKIETHDIPNEVAKCCLKSPICYHVEDDNFELLSFHLNKFNGEKQFMSNTLSRFRKDLKNWKKYNEDRLFVGDYSPWKHK